MTFPKIDTAMLNGGNSANQLLRLDATGKLPPLDGSQLLSLPLVATTGMVLLATQDAAGMSQVDFTSGIDATYKEYVVRATDVRMNGTTHLGLRVRAGGVFQTAGEYTHGGHFWNYNGGPALLSNANNDCLPVIPVNQAIDTSHSNAGFVFSISNPANNARVKAMHVTGGGIGNGFNQSFSYHIAGVWNGGDSNYSPIDGLRFFAGASQTINKGTFKLYGIQ